MRRSFTVPTVMMILMMLMELGKYNKIQSVSTAKVTATWWWLSNWKFFLNIFFIVYFFSYVIFKFNKFQKLHFILQTCTRPFRILHHGSNLSRVFCSDKYGNIMHNLAPSTWGECHITHRDITFWEFRHAGTEP